MQAAKTYPPRPRSLHWSRAEYYQLIDLGIFRDRRVERLNGRIIEMPPQRDPHAAGILLAVELMRGIFTVGYVVRPQLPLAIGKRSDPEPDVAVVVGKIRDYVGTGHPTTAAIVIEVSDTTLRYDRRKQGLYARAGIADYWIVNLPDRRLEVHRNPVPDRSRPFRHGYLETTIFLPGQACAPLAAPTRLVAVSDLLP